MHEMGVTFHIADSVVKVAEENNVSHVLSVTLQLGEVSTVLPDYLTDVWNWNCKRVPVLNNCELIIEEIHAVNYCTNCKRTYDTVPQGRICPYCGSEKTYLLKGNEITIKEIAVEE